jgi:Fe-S cluster assembly iron-binding protein IscA
MQDQELISKISEALQNAKSSISATERWLEKLSKNMGLSTDSIKLTAKESNLSEFDGDEKIIEGLFDGQNMIDKEGNIYPIPTNYASKSKLVEGDQLKLTIAENGAFIFKQIELVPRELKIGHLVMEGSQYQVLVDNHTYNVLYASVTFFRANIGDQVTIIVPQNKTSKWGAVENVIPSTQLEELVV